MTLKRLYEKYREVIMFAAVGLINTGADFCVFTLILALVPTASPAPAQAAGYTFGLLCSFFLNKHLTFRSNAKGLPQIVKFILCNLFTLAVSVAAITLCVDVIGLQEHLSKLFLVTPVTMVLNFLGYKFIVFRKRNSK